MTIDELRNDFRSDYAIAKSFGYTPSTVNYWRKIGYIPAGAQAKINYYTNDKYKITHTEEMDK